MIGYTRSIRGIERSAAYARTHPVNRYAAYRLTSFERTAPVPQQWSLDIYQKSSESVYVWLKTAGEGQKLLADLMSQLGRNGGVGSKDQLNASVQTLVEALNRWEGVYRGYERLLRPEIWEALELAMRHPGMEGLGIVRREPAESVNTEAFERESAFGKDPGYAQTESLRRQLLGSEGLLMSLKRALSYAEQFPPIRLLQLPFATAYPYAMYYGGAQAYLPLPPRGTIMNKYV
ncbi:hypothetical protein [Paenibacillus soyae]|uniref:Uncharacterized protein n=1 Tax=Paenibacillus soyae TaxID=2969249 RepID=A0A9X2MIA1_9BACL|nr:hypothetical protein [Paenibacillus soyae]MCR2802273.1 hypothetical protein [Paenibacillus soyae]